MRFFLYLLLLFSIKLVAHTKEIPESNPIHFIENKGQMVDMDHHPVPFVLYEAELPGTQIYITEKGLTYMFLKSEEDEEEGEKRKERISVRKNKIKINKEEDIKTEWNRIDMTLEGAFINKESIVKEGLQNSSRHYFLPHCPNGITDVHSFEKITIKNIYSGIDWVLHQSEKGFKYDFIVHPGADYKQIVQLYTSLKHLKLDTQDNIEIKTKLGSLIEHAPVSFLDEKKIASQFIKISDQKTKTGGYETRIQFSIPSITSTLEKDLVIDPLLTWSTFYGAATSYDGIIGITTDTLGNLYATGYTRSTDFPVLDAGTFFQGTTGGYTDAVILKFDNLGVLMWSTYYGGSASQLIEKRLTTTKHL